MDVFMSDKWLGPIVLWCLIEVGLSDGRISVRYMFVLYFLSGRCIFNGCLSDIIILNGFKIVEEHFSWDEGNQSVIQHPIEHYPVTPFLKFWLHPLKFPNATKEFNITGFKKILKLINQEWHTREIKQCK